MIESSQFGSQMPRSGIDSKACAQFEAMLADAVDGLLTPEDQAIFDEHAKGCAACSVQLAEAQRGAAWLSMLKADPPEPNGALVDRILAETSVRAAAEREALKTEQRARAEQASLMGGSLRGTAAPAPAEAVSGVLPFRTKVALRLRPISHTVLQPRFMMTAAMAFFSIALTLNVTGVRLDQIHASDLKPSSLRRSFYQANAHVVRYYDNLRVVYELESRVRDLQRSSDDNGTGTAYPGAPAQATPDSKQKDGVPGTDGTAKPAEPRGKTPDGAVGHRPDPKSGSSRREAPTPELMQVACNDGTSRLSAAVASPETTSTVWESFGRAL